MLLAKLERNYLFTGDTILLTAGCKPWPNTSAFTRNPSDVEQSVKKLRDYNFDVILPVHGTRAFIEDPKNALNF